jgi:hypothetical protein
VTDIIPTRVVPAAQVGTLPVAEIDPWADIPLPSITLQRLPEQRPAQVETDTPDVQWPPTHPVLYAVFYTEMITASASLVAIATIRALWPLVAIVGLSLMAWFVILAVVDHRDSRRT